MMGNIIYKHKELITWASFCFSSLEKCKEAATVNRQYLYLLAVLFVQNTCVTYSLFSHEKQWLLLISTCNNQMYTVKVAAQVKKASLPGYSLK